MLNIISMFFFIYECTLIQIWSKIPIMVFFFYFCLKNLHKFVYESKELSHIYKYQSDKVYYIKCKGPKTIVTKIVIFS